MTMSRQRLMLQAEVALAATSVVWVLSLGRLLTSWNLVLSVVLPMTLVGHVVAALARRARVNFAVTYVASFVMVTEVLSLGLYGHTLFWGFVPTRATLGAARVDLTAAVDNFREVVAPAEFINGYVIVTGAAAWLLALAADTAAFRTRSTTLAVLPAIVASVFIGVLATDNSVWWAALVALAVMAFIAAHRPYTSAVPWLAPVSPSGSPTGTAAGAGGVWRSSSPIRVALGLGIVAAVSAAFVAPLVPGTPGEGLVDLRDIDGVAPAPRTTLSPLVDARGRLTGSSSATMFTVEADRPSYWRMSGLDVFNGAVWGSQRSYENAQGDLRSPSPDEELIHQRFTVDSLSGLWIPAAFEPISFTGVDALYDGETGAIVTATDLELTSGMTYTVVSAAQPTTAASLRASTQTAPAQLLADATALPDGFSERIREFAIELTAEVPSAFDKALVLQEFFRTNFSYSLEVSAGHSNNRMEQFLFDEQIGYCEQFAGTYAAMARAVGLPARVAVGFTQGDLVDGAYVVRGEHYHAWPEVWIAGQWLAFEPTPGRGAPGAESYTGRPAEQATALTGDEGDEATDDAETDDEESSDFEGFVDELGTADDGGDATSGGRWLAVASLAALGAVVIWLVAVPSLRVLARRRRHRAAQGDTRAETMACWDDLVDVLRREGVERRAHESARRFAERATRTSQLGSRRPSDELVEQPSDGAEPMVEAADLADAACFAPAEPSADDVSAMRSRVAGLLARWRKTRPFTERVRALYRTRNSKVR